MAVGRSRRTSPSPAKRPVVDVKSSRAQTQFEKVDDSRRCRAGPPDVLSDIVSGATLTQEFNRGVGGTSDRTQTRYSVHGGPRRSRTSTA
jgi:hypothetical protein